MALSEIWIAYAGWMASIFESIDGVNVELTPGVYVTLLDIFVALMFFKVLIWFYKSVISGDYKTASSAYKIKKDKNRVQLAKKKGD